MNIKILQISNILSFQHVDDISNATEITFDNELNILIGENGSGKSTVLEVINFTFKQVLFAKFNLNYELYLKRDTLLNNQKRNIL